MYVLKKQEKYFNAVLQVIILGHQLTDDVSMALKPMDITEPQFNVLRILRGQKGNPITVQEIQSRMIQRTSNVTRIIDKLLVKGFVSRAECAHNRRKMDICITSEGEAYLLQLDAILESLHKPMIDKLTAEELTELNELLIKLKA